MYLICQVRSTLFSQMQKNDLKCKMYLRVTGQITQPNYQKTKKKSPQKTFLIFPGMDLSSSNIKKVIIFSQIRASLYILKRKIFLYFQKWNPELFSPSSKNKKIYPKKTSYTSGNGNLPKNSYISQKKALLF